MVQEVKVGTSAALEQAGLPHAYWHIAMRHFEASWNFTEKRGLPAPWKTRYGEDFEGTLIPFGALVTFHPIYGGHRRKQPFATRSVPGMFVGYHFRADGSWSGDYLVLPLDDLQGMDLTRGANVDRACLFPQRTSKVFVTEPIAFPAKSA